MIKLLKVFSLLFIISCAKAQPNPKAKVHIGGPCEGCEAIYEYGEKTLSSIDTLPGFNSAHEKIRISGIIYQSDGRTPAANVILYAYQTNEKGIYQSNPNSKGWEKRHGTIRAWVKTAQDGAYTLFTFRPASYPNTTIAQHIHLTVKEPDKNEYYIDDIYFDDDPNLDASIRQRKNFRAGKGIVKLSGTGSVLEAKRDIILGLNIPDYQ